MIHLNIFSSQQSHFNLFLQFFWMKSSYRKPDCVNSSIKSKPTRTRKRNSLDCVNTFLQRSIYGLYFACQAIKGKKQTLNLLQAMSVFFLAASTPACLTHIFLRSFLFKQFYPATGIWLF